MDIEKKQETTSESVPSGKESSIGFSKRLREAMAGRSIREFASSASMSAGTLHNYLNDESLPTLDKLISLSNTAGVSLNWLATGRGPVSFERELGESTNNDAVHKLNIDLLTEALECIEQAISTLRITMTPEKKSLVAVLIYDLFLEQGEQPVSREKVFRLIESAIA